MRARERVCACEDIYSKRYKGIYFMCVYISLSSDARVDNGECVKANFLLKALLEDLLKALQSDLTHGLTQRVCAHAFVRLRVYLLCG